MFSQGIKEGAGELPLLAPDGASFTDVCGTPRPLPWLLVTANWRSSSAAEDVITAMMEFSRPNKTCCNLRFRSTNNLAVT